MGRRVDTSEVLALARDFDRAPARLNRDLRKVFTVGANKIKKGMRADLRDGLSRSRSYLPELVGKINYDPVAGAGDVEFEVGIDKGGQGDLGNVAAFGTSNNAAVFDHTASLRREIPDLVRYSADAAENALPGTG